MNPPPSELIAEIAHEASRIFRRADLGDANIRTSELPWSELLDRQRETMVTLVEELRNQPERATTFVSRAGNEWDARNNAIVLGIVWAMTLELEVPAPAVAPADDSAEGGTSEPVGA